MIYYIDYVVCWLHNIFCSGKPEITLSTNLMFKMDDLLKLETHLSNNLVPLLLLQNV